MNKYNLKNNSLTACIDIKNQYRVQLDRFRCWDTHIYMKHIIYIKDNNPTKINITDTNGNVLKTNPTYKDYPVLYYMIGEV